MFYSPIWHMLGWYFKFIAYQFIFRYNYNNKAISAQQYFVSSTNDSLYKIVYSIFVLNTPWKIQVSLWTKAHFPVTRITIVLFPFVFHFIVQLVFDLCLNQYMLCPFISPLPTRPMSLHMDWDGKIYLNPGAYNYSHYVCCTIYRSVFHGISLHLE